MFKKEKETNNNQIQEEKPMKEVEENHSAGNLRVYNLIILDESGSMSAIRQEALTGVNETLQTIRMAKEEHSNQEQFVTLVTFDTGHYNEIYKGTPAGDAIDITPDQYWPNGGTPLYDTMGRAITELRNHIEYINSKNEPRPIVLVTIITDGYENASREYNGPAIKALIEEMRKQDWVFTYIGANQDVEKVAASMAINNHMAFAADSEGTKAMFCKDRRARSKFFDKADAFFRGHIDKTKFEEDYFEG